MPSRPRPVTLATWLGTLIGLAFVVRHGLRSYVLTDYGIEALPAMDAFVAGDLSGFLRLLPGYGGALLLESPFALLGQHTGPDSATGVWRSLAVPGLVLLGALAVNAGRRVGNARTPALGFVTALVVAGSPLGLLAQQTGHPEEWLTVGLMLGGVMLAARGRMLSAGVLLGLAAAGKPWALIAVPVALCACVDLRQAARLLAATVVAGALLLAPVMLGSGTTVNVKATATATGTFKPSSVFWFAGRENPRWAEVQAARTFRIRDPDATKAIWAQRLDPGWAGRISHPVVVLFAGALALAFWWRRRHDAARADDLLLLLAAVCWGRCVLDTWNLHYYAFGAVTSLALWEAHRRRPPLLTVLVTALVCATFRPWSDVKYTPDLQAALYLGWALPLLGWFALRLLSPQLLARWQAPVAAAVGRRVPTVAGWVAPPAPGGTPDIGRSSS